MAPDCTDEESTNEKAGKTALLSMIYLRRTMIVITKMTERVTAKEFFLGECII